MSFDYIMARHLGFLIAYISPEICLENLSRVSYSQRGILSARAHVTSFQTRCQAKPLQKQCMHDTVSFQMSLLFGVYVLSSYAHPPPA